MAVGCHTDGECARHIQQAFEMGLKVFASQIAVTHFSGTAEDIGRVVGSAILRQYSFTVTHMLMFLHFPVSRLCWWCRVQRRR